MRTKCLLFVGVIQLLLQSGCEQDKELFKAPEKKGIAYPEQMASLSTITISSLIPYSLIKQSINESLPDSVSFSGSKNDCLCANHPAAGTREHCINVPYLDFRGAGMRRQCVNLPAIVSRRACAGCRWSGNINRNGEAQLSRANNSTRISQALSITGSAGVRGDLASLLSLSGKNFSASLNPTFDLTFDLNDQWCPVVGVTPHQQWVSNASVEIIGRSCVGINLGPLGHPQTCAGPVNISLASEANDAISENMSSITESIKTSIPCNAIKSIIGNHWRTMSFPINLPDNDPLHLNIELKSAAFSGLIPVNDGLQFTVDAGVVTKIESDAIESKVLPLPKLGRIGNTDSNLKVHLPAQIPFSRIAESLNVQFLNNDIIDELGSGNIKIQVNDITVYPSNENLVLGLSIKASLPGSLFTTTGWVYLIGVPRIENNGTGIFIDDLKFGSVLDSEFWNVVSSLFNGKIKTTLIKNSKIDLDPLLKEYQQKVSDQISSINIDGLTISSDVTKILAENIRVFDRGLSITLILGSTFDVSISSIN